MPPSSRPAPVERAKALLGTYVSVRAVAADAAAANAAIDAAFAEIEAVHRLMSFHEADSDLSRLNRAAPGEAIVVDARTAAVLAFALELAEQSGGVFDPTVAGRLVACGALPRPPGATDPDPGASWRVIALEDETVRLTRPVWLDLGGVAKGFAVDRAIEVLVAHGATEGCVNAGGDLRVFGPEPTLIELRAGDPDNVPVLELNQGAAASSGGGRLSGAHVDGRSRTPIDPARFACVTAPTCMAADALTKVVLGLGVGARPLLHRHRAHAYAFDDAHGWTSWEQAA